MALAAVDIALAAAAFVRYQRQRRFAVDAAHALPVVGRQRLLDELNVQLGQLARIGDRLVRAPAAVGVHAEGHVGFAAQGTHDFQVVFRAQFDLVNRKTRHFTQLGQHRCNRIDANGEIGARHALDRKVPEFVERRPLALAPEIPGRHVEGAERKGVVGQERGGFIPEAGGIEVGKGFDHGADLLEGGAQSVEGDAIVVIGGGLAIAAMAAILQGDDQRGLLILRFARNAERMAQAQYEVLPGDLDFRGCHGERPHFRGVLFSICL